MRHLNLAIAAVTLLFPGGVAHAQESRIARPASPPQTWVTPDDYPPQEIIDEAEGATGVTLAIDADGFPSKCNVTRSSGSPRLDRIACERLMERAIFYPARNDRGEQVEGSYSTRVVWVLPERAPMIPESHFEATFIVDEMGEMSECTLVTSENVPPDFFEGGCPAGSDYIPFIDNEGNPVARRVRVEFRVSYEIIED